MRRRVILLLPLLFACGHCAAPEPAPQPNPSTDSATIGGDPVSAPDPAPLPAATDAPENTVATEHPPLASARPQASVEAARASRRAAGRVQSDEPVPCDAVDDDVSAADCREFTRQKARLRPGILAFDPPAKMTVGVTYDLTLSIGKATDAEEIRAVVRREGRRLEERTLQVGAFMTATLTGNAFEIALQGTEGPSRSLGADRRDIWQWQVKPLRAGTQRLLLTVSADAMGADGKRRRFSLANRPVDILVEVTASQRREDRTRAIEDSLGRGARVMSALEKWMIGLAALLAAVGGAWLALRKFGKPKEVAADKPPNP
ncbi:hypothetical protein [Sphingomonas psychrotolerans]|nr:hypothetical protein [Sphingomonas psychrotolerans]